MSTRWVGGKVAWILVLGLAAAGRPARAEESPALQEASYDRMRGLGGPTSVPKQLQEDHRDLDAGRLRVIRRTVHPYDDFKARLHDRYGLSYGLDYTLLYLASTARRNGGPDDGFGGVFRFYGRWAPLCRGSDYEGALVWKVENRSVLGTEITPYALGPSVGSLFPADTVHRDWGWGVTNLQWQQNLRVGRVKGGFILGQVDMTDWVDVLAIGSPWTGFVSGLPILYPTNPAPDQGLGAMAVAFLGERRAPYVLVGVSDANGEPWEWGFDSFFDVREYYSYAEIGWTSTYERRYDDNLHVTFWHQDEKSASGTPEAWGVSGSATWKFCQDRWAPFLRGGYSSDQATIAKGYIAGGIGHYFENGDVAGFGASWAKPFDDNLRDQWSFELFYNFSLGKHIHVTPDVQVVVDPTNNPQEHVIAFLGARLRVDL